MTTNKEQKNKSDLLLALEQLEREKNIKREDVFKTITDSLVSALRKRGYAVTVRRDPADNQFHVRIGPFTSRNDANATRQKLLNDGYNAIVQP